VSQGVPSLHIQLLKTFSRREARSGHGPTGTTCHAKTDSDRGHRSQTCSRRSGLAALEGSRRELTTMTIVQAIRADVPALPRGDSNAPPTMSAPIRIRT